MQISDDSHKLSIQLKIELNDFTIFCRKNLILSWDAGTRVSIAARFSLFSREIIVFDYNFVVYFSCNVRGRARRRQSQTWSRNGCHVEQHGIWERRSIESIFVGQHTLCCVRRWMEEDSMNVRLVYYWHKPNEHAKTNLSRNKFKILSNLQMRFQLTIIWEFNLMFTVEPQTPDPTEEFFSCCQIRDKCESATVQFPTLQAPDSQADWKVEKKNWNLLEKSTKCANNH